METATTAGQFRRYDHLERFAHPEVEGIEFGQVYIFPKLDGTNGSVWVDAIGKVQCGSRNRVLSIENDNAGFCAWVNSDDPKAVELCRFVELHPMLVVYGEWLVPHTLRIYREDAWKRFFVFDVWSHEGGYLSYEQYDGLMRPRGIDLIAPLCIINNPSLEQLQVQVAVNTYLIADGAGVGEGVVAKNYAWKNRYGRQPWAKLVRNEFKEEAALAHGTTEKDGPFQVEVAIVDEFVTPTLVGKCRAKIVTELASKAGIDLAGPNAQKLVEEANRKSLIPRLLQQVFYDLITEETWAFVKKHKNPTIDFAKLCKLSTLATKRLAQDLF